MSYFQNLNDAFRNVSPLCGFLNYSSYFATDISLCCSFTFIAIGAEHQNIDRTSFITE